VRLVVPHYISGKRDVTILSRVAKPERKVFVRVSEIDVKEFHMAVRPAEMIKLDLKKEALLKAVNESKITLEVVPVG
jgi:hypothetical protein